MRPSSSTVRTAPRLNAVRGLSHGFETSLAARRGVPREEARRSVAECLQSQGRVFFMTQVHGTRVVAVPWDEPPEADAALVTGLGRLAAVETADCLPVLLVDPEAGIAAAVHAGWRGSAAGILECALEAMTRAGAAPARLLAALGPCIGACCYEVGNDVREAFGAGSEGFFLPGRSGRAHLDLRAANRAQLLAAGLNQDHVETVGGCTFCNPERLPSFRREGRDCGRIVSYVGWVGSAQA